MKLGVLKQGECYRICTMAHPGLGAQVYVGTLVDQDKNWVEVRMSNTPNEVVVINLDNVISYELRG